MAQMSEQNVRRRQLFCLPGYFAPRTKPFWRPSDLTQLSITALAKRDLEALSPRYAALPTTEWTQTSKVDLTSTDPNLGQRVYCVRCPSANSVRVSF